MATITECPTCRDRDVCIARPVTEREATFAWAFGVPFDTCPDYREDSYKGVAGCVDLVSLDRASRGSVYLGHGCAA